MKDLALYRKYRPSSFSDVLGQEHIISVLEGSIAQNNIAHAYIFAGSRGTGKTSTARIFAKEIGTSRNDMYEIDGASNRGIESIRELRDAVHVSPLDSPYKVYIIDEAHMLTPEAFNALLKTLEEPPSHVIFILATTEVNKIPGTVVSRCQTFTFKKPSQKILKEVVLRIAKAEGYKLESSSADLIALLGEGSFRDTQGILQKVISFSADKKISVSEVEQITGAPETELVNEVVTAIDDGLIEKGLGAIRKADETNADMKIFLKLLLHKCRAVLLLRYATGLEEELREEFSEIDFKLLKELSQKKDLNINSSVLKRLLDVSGELKNAYITSLPLELALIDLIAELPKK
jgi:DNA polymerase III subunit gamma/tau